MSARPRIVVLTGNGRRHRYVASCLNAQFDVAGIVIEAKRNPLSGPDTATSEVRRDEILASHFAERDAAEALVLGDRDWPAVRPTLAVPTGEINDPEVFDWVRSRAPDFLLLYGAGIVKDPLLSAFAERTINMHLGLSPYFRGAATNFWPLVEGLPECVGVTIHLAVAKVDAGPILAQVRPIMLPGDSIHTIGTRAIVAGTTALIAAVRQYAQGCMQAIPQVGDAGKLFRRHDFCSAAVQSARVNLDRGMIGAYLADKPQRDAAYPIFTGAGLA